jgi:hypothetical protein
MTARRTSILAALSILAGAGILCSSLASDGDIGRAKREIPLAVGQLTCTVIGETAADPSGVAQGRDVLCQFRPGISGAEETYVGTLQGAGQVKTLFERGTLMLVVKQYGSDAVTPGMLAQSYSADAAARAGRSAPLIGDRNNAVVLQPMIERDAGDQAKKGDIPDAIIVLAELKLEASAA